ncbi:MAG: hypothetical protein ABI665_06165 [Vicinamibacterales bacterium]
MADSKNSKAVDTKLVAYAEKLGTLLGTASRKADGLIDREAVSKELRRIRDRAADLLAQVNRARAKRKTARAAKKKSAEKKKKKATPRPSRGLVDAPGKKHRKPPPQERVDLHSSAPAVKKLGRKNLQGIMRPRQG